MRDAPMVQIVNDYNNLGGAIEVNGYNTYHAGFITPAANSSGGGRQIGITYTADAEL